MAHCSMVYCNMANYSMVEDTINMSILHSDSKGQDRGESRNYVL